MATGALGLPYLTRSTYVNVAMAHNSPRSSFSSTLPTINVRPVFTSFPKARAGGVPHRAQMIHLQLHLGGIACAAGHVRQRIPNGLVRNCDNQTTVQRSVRIEKARLQRAPDRHAVATRFRNAQLRKLRKGYANRSGAGRALAIPRHMGDRFFTSQTRSFGGIPIA